MVGPLFAALLAPTVYLVVPLLATVRLRLVERLVLARARVAPVVLEVVRRPKEKVVR